MMFGYKQHIAEARVPGHTDPLVRIKTGGIVLRHGNGAVAPFHISKRIRSEMDEHSVSATLHGLLHLIWNIPGGYFLRSDFSHTVQ